jgi:competence CoiA-like predicted nuclease
MIWAIQNNQRITANPNQKAICPVCNAEVISKCGSIKVWHWSHLSAEDCDSWSEGETEWHLKWKNEFPKEWQEVVVGKHRADVKTSKGLVIEFQNSSISNYNIQERENYYAEMIWLLNGETIGNNLNLIDKETYYSFKWKWFPKSWLISKKQIYIDLSYLKNKLFKQIEEYSYGKKHYSTITNYTYEWEDDSGYVREGEYRHYYTEDYEDTETYLASLQKIFNKINSKDIFLLKKIYDNGTGWGLLISKEEFLKQFE